MASGFTAFCRGAVGPFFGLAQGLGAELGEASYQAPAAATKFTAETVESYAGSPALGTAAAGTVGAGVIFLFNQVL